MFGARQENMSVVEDVRKVLQDFLAPELRSIGTRMDALEKQRGEDKADLLRVIAQDKADLLRAISDVKTDIQHSIVTGNAHMEKRFELVVDYTKVLQRVDKLEEAQHSKSN
jgi:hypothetical protein